MIREGARWKNYFNDNYRQFILDPNEICRPRVRNLNFLHNHSELGSIKFSSRQHQMNLSEVGVNVNMKNLN